MSSFEVIDRIHVGLKNHFRQLEVTEIPIANGGEGFGKVPNGVSKRCMGKKAKVNTAELRLDMAVDTMCRLLKVGNALEF